MRACVRDALRAGALGFDTGRTTMHRTPAWDPVPGTFADRRELAAMPIHWRDETLHVTASFGVSVALPSEVAAEALISRADQALYRAKDQGRNCVRLATEPALV